MSEAKFQAKIIKQYTKEGWYCLKLIQTNKNGVADLLMLKRGEDPLFIECKAKGKKAAPLQEYRHKEIFEKTGIKTLVMVEGS